MHRRPACADANCSITPVGSVAVGDGNSQSFTIAADAHYHILDVKVDGVSVGAVASYNFSDVTADHTIEATFAITQHTIAAIARASCRKRRYGSVAKCIGVRRVLMRTARSRRPAPSLSAMAIARASRSRRTPTTTSWT